MDSLVPAPTLPASTLPLTVLVLLLLALAVPAAAVGQSGPPPRPLPAPSDTVYEVRLADGSTLFARVEAASDERVELRTVGEIRFSLAPAQILGMQPATGRIVRGEYWRRDPNGSRLFFTATGRSLGQGQAYVGTYLILLPFVAVGMTDDITLGFGAPLTVGSFEPFYLAPKVRVFHAESAGRATDLAIGVLHFVLEDEQAGVAYAVGTVGTTDNAVTGGLGFGYSGSDLEWEPVAMIGFEGRTGRRSKFITENYYVPGAGVVLSGGLRFIGERFSVDVGLAAAVGEDGGGCCLPLVNFSWATGGGR